jgi:hypothetical protein
MRSFPLDVIQAGTIGADAVVGPAVAFLRLAGTRARRGAARRGAAQSLENIAE